MSQQHTLILGGARRGKSRFADQLATDSNKPLIYIATANAGDEEMTARITRHQAERAKHLTLVE